MGIICLVRLWPDIYWLTRDLWSYDIFQEGMSFGNTVNKYCMGCKMRHITQYGSTVYIGMALVWPAL